MYNYRQHLLSIKATVKEAMAQLNELAADAILFLVEEDDKLIGSLTDGDIRRGFLQDYTFETPLREFIQPNPKYIIKYDYDLLELIRFRENHFKIIPVLDKTHRIIQIINFRVNKSYLPIDAVIMAGGKGERLKPLTETIPKPLLKVGDKPIIDHNISRLMHFGIDDFWITVRYLSDKMHSHFSSGYDDINLQLVNEDKPLGTIGAVGLIQNLIHDHILLTNSDILTNLDYEDFYLKHLEAKADLSVVTIPYSVNIPYAVLETSNDHVVSFKEKPTYTYYSNGGIYLFKKGLIDLIPADTPFDATDFMDTLINMGKKVFSYPLRGYWLDIGKHEDFKKAEEEIKSIKW